MLPALTTLLVRQNSELLAITYGALVAQLVEDYEDPAAINEQLDARLAALRRESATMVSASKLEDASAARVASRGSAPRPRARTMHSLTNVMWPT